MKTHPTPLFFLFSLFLLLLHAPPSSADHLSTSPYSGGGGATNDFDFIRESCNATLYPDVCFRSLSRYASAVSQNSAQLARVAIGVSLSKTRRAAAYFSNLTRYSDFAYDHRAASAVRDCSSTFSDAVGQMRGSFKRMCRLGSGGSGGPHRSLRFQLSDVQTWMSAALTNEDTCTDGFDGVSNGQLKTDVGDRVAKVTKLTSNALALVNSYASTLN